MAKQVTPVRSRPHGKAPQTDPTIRLNISMATSEHQKLTSKAESLGISLSRLLADSALSDQSLQAMTTKQVIGWQQKRISDLSNECDVWMFGGSGPKFPFVEGENSDLSRIWSERAEQGVHHHVFWDVDLADTEGLKQFIKGTTSVARVNKQKGWSGRIFHHAVTVGRIYPDRCEAYQSLSQRVAAEGLGDYLKMSAMFDVCEAAGSSTEEIKAAAREARWLCRFGEMGSLVAVLPRSVDKPTSASIRYDSLLVQPEGKAVDLWLWLERNEAGKLADHANAFLDYTQQKIKSGE